MTLLLLLLLVASNGHQYTNSNINPTLAAVRCDDSFFMTGVPLGDGSAIRAIYRVYDGKQRVGYVYTTVAGHRFFGARHTTSAMVLNSIYHQPKYNNTILSGAVLKQITTLPAPYHTEFCAGHRM